MTCDTRMDYICTIFYFGYDFCHSNEGRARKNENKLLWLSVNYLHDSLKKEINRKNKFLNFNSSNENCNLSGKIT